MKHPGLACLLNLQLALSLGGQSPAAPTTEKLKLQIVAGQAAIHNIRQRVASGIQVQVIDGENHPISGARVNFELPNNGAGGTFAKDSTSATATTDALGRAFVRGFRANDIAGKFTIAVSASYGGETAHATITQFNVLVEKASHKSSNGKVVAILGIVGAAAAGGAYAATHKSASPAPSTPAPVPTIGISPGTGVAGPPR